MFTSPSNDCLPLLREQDTGGVEYKWKLLNKTPLRVSHLTTQMKFRLHEGAGRCLYEVGVLDNGFPEGVSDLEMRETLDTLRRMARALGAEVRVLKTARGARGAVAEVEVTEGGGGSWVDVRVAVIGAEQSGKSTLVGVLCTGKRDNGRGSARMNVFRHRHEVESGYTSSLSSQLLGFSASGEALNAASTSPSPSSFSSHSWSSITDAAAKIVTFSDLVGHESGQKVTMPSLLSDAVDYALIVVGAGEGMTPMDRECIGVCEGLGIRFVVVVTKVDLVDAHRTHAVVGEVEEIVTAPGRDKRLVHMRTKEDVTAFAAAPGGEVVPLFTLSSVTGLHVDVFSAFLSVLAPHKDWSPAQALPSRFSIDSIYSIDDTSIVGGLVEQGALTVDQRLLLGPVGQKGSFLPVTITSIHIKRRDVRRALAGQTASLGLSLHPSATHSHLRRGLLLFDEATPAEQLTASLSFDAVLTMSSPPEPLLLYYQPVLYMPNIRQSAMLLAVTPVSGGRPGEYTMRFRWCYFPEHVVEGCRVVLREGHTRGVGRVVKAHVMAEDEEKAGEADPERVVRAEAGGSGGLKRRRGKAGRTQKRRASAAISGGEEKVAALIDSPVSSDPSSPFALAPSPGPLSSAASSIHHSSSLPAIPHSTGGSRSLMDATAASPSPSFPPLLRALSPLLQLLTDGRTGSARACAREGS